VAGLSAKLRMREIVREPIGSPVSIYARTIECRIARSLGDNSFPDNSISVFNYTVTDRRSTTITDSPRDFRITNRQGDFPGGCQVTRVVGYVALGYAKPDCEKATRWRTFFAGS
jgi:hypothetical protein